MTVRERMKRLLSEAAKPPLKWYKHANQDPSDESLFTNPDGDLSYMLVVRRDYQSNGNDLADTWGGSVIWKGMTVATPKGFKTRREAAEAVEAEYKKHAKKAVAPPSKKGPTVSLEAVASMLKHLHTKTGGSFRSVHVEAGNYPSVWAEPEYRERLDHYGTSRSSDDEEQEGWDEEGWYADWAGPLEKEVNAALAKHFPGVKFFVEVGEKGHVSVQIGK